MIIGYISVIAYIGLLLVISKLIYNKNGSSEVGRKVVHIGTLGVLPIAEICFDSTLHLVIICAFFVVFNVVSYSCNLVKCLERQEKRTPGTIYYSVALFVVYLLAYFVPFFKAFANCSFAVLTIGDGMAAILGRVVNSPKLVGNKTIVGTVGCVVFSFVAIFVLNIVCNYGIDIISLVATALVVGICELVGNGLDNFSVPFGAFAMLLLCNILGFNFAMACTICSVVFYLAFMSHAITLGGSLCAFAIGFVFYYFGGVADFLFVVALYCAMIVVWVVSKLLKNDVSSVVAKTGGKDFVEVFVNGVWAFVGEVLYAVTSLFAFRIIALVAISASFIDSVSSDVGTLSKHKPYDIIHKKFVEKGVSGGVTVLGTMAGLVSSVVCAVAIHFITNCSVWATVVGGVCIFFNTICDSLLGSTIQAKYQCKVCGKVTEHTVHCNENTTLISGKAFINNDFVNLLSSFISFALSMVVIALC